MRFNNTGVMDAQLNKVIISALKRWVTSFILRPFLLRQKWNFWIRRETKLRKYSCLSTRPWSVISVIICSLLNWCRLLLHKHEPFTHMIKCAKRTESPALLWAATNLSLIMLSASSFQSQRLLYEQVIYGLKLSDGAKTVSVSSQ
jgi:hypothetical protein